MSLSIDQITAASYPAVLAEMRKGATSGRRTLHSASWRSRALFSRKDLGPTIEVPLDYRPNPDTAVLAGDQDTASLVKTEILHVS
jgi:hypothetical protein